MNIEQKYQLSKVVKVLEKVLNENDKNTFVSPKNMFHLITDYRYSDVAFYEHTLNLIHKELFNIISYLKFDSEELVVLDEVTGTLGDVMNETQETYHYSVIDEKGTEIYTTDREGHIIGILEWALDYIAGNIEVEEK